MILAPTLGALAASPAALGSDAGWRPLGQRSSALGPVAVRGQTLDGVPCFEGALLADVPVVALLQSADRMREAPTWARARLSVSRELERSETRFALLQVLDVPAWTLAADRV